jgi:diguanylate cyclase (GGDEF)-like protein
MLPPKLNSVQRLIARMAIVMLAVAALLVGIVFYSGRVMDQASLANQQALIDNAFSARLVRANSELRSVAWWDEAVQKSSASGFDREWLDLEVGAFMTESYGHNQIAILDEGNRTVYGFPADVKPSMRDTDLKAQLMGRLIDQVRGGPNVSRRIKDTNLLIEAKKSPDVSDRKTGRSAGALSLLGGRPVMISIMAITPSVDYRLKPKRPRLLVSLIEIDSAFLQDVGSNTLLRDLRFSKEPGKFTGELLLKADDGASLGRLVWTARQPGSEMVRKVLPWIIACLLVAIGLMVVLMIKLTKSTAQLAEREEEARFLADHDALTGLPNRRMLERIYEERLRGPKSTDSRLIVACIDLDRFKDINDTMGHHAGDDLIKAVGMRLQDRLEENDTLARLGGDEFAILRPVPWMSNIDGLTDLVSGCFEEPFDVTGHMIECNASIGLAFADRNDSFDQSIKRADIALYDAKASGRGRSSRFTAAMSQSLEKRHAIETDLRRALSAGDLTLSYQPIIEAHTGAISSVEALVRWVSPTHGQVAPDLFVNIAEESGMMAQLGRFVINQAFADARRWPELTTAINISPAQLRSATIVSDLLGASERCGVPPKMITLEITETVLMSNDERTLRVLNTLKENGFALALDDFGTGYSSLAYLRDFPFDRLKIDRSFVKGLSVNDRALSIVEAVVNFGHILGRDIVAEGIETEQEMQAMQQAGCTHLQGWLFSKALPADHIEALAATFGRLSARRDFSGDEAATSSVAEAVSARRKTAARPRRRRSA